ncbi:hypothetical protein M406DRAFT_257710 [Cryphonectria parasitica EP155]|uniref:Uncharacterized protein n=1 Tax=Cryphonectria parasitica (strain ATCC 38755 / EP155) TaxID=660469 RepID=A0A9P4Y2Z2_CRYP1|nr:uncharacterized protein M406DRAFT_257710 [Cryphonectria parasitica EP155]KAF3765676.1 hypothetical protein M406DRAFT_257710 [Cryphonectria parasitica EP155]
MQLYGVAAACLDGANVLDEVLPGRSCGTFIRLNVEAKDSYYLLLSGSGSSFAVLDTRTIDTLVAARHLPLRFEAVVDISSIPKRQKTQKRRSQQFGLSLNIYGPKIMADEVSTLLSAAPSAYLQHPKALAPDIEYFNPQFLRFADDHSDMQKYVGITNSSPWSDRRQMSDEINDILNSLAEVGAESDFQVQPCEKSTLKNHQVDGVRFILQRENGQASWSQVLIDKVRIGASISPRSDCRPQEYYGGLIADVMGLGKTLTMLTAVVHSLPEAEEYGNFCKVGDANRGDKLPTKSTLVVVPSTQLLESWRSEITEHFIPGTLNTVIFHGQHRPQDPASLRTADVTLTTYATLVADFNAGGILYRMLWYRIVLDEAHWIRNSGTKQYRAVDGLSSRNRWCLTGTPIQNKIDDIASLAGFLRLSPFLTKAEFQKHILAPLSQGGPDFAKPLRGYLEAYCLRRTEKRLNLPRSFERIVQLDISPEERSLYDDILTKLRREVDDLVSTGHELRRYNKLFTAILKLRMLCNLGTFSIDQRAASLPGQKEHDVSCERCSASDEDITLLLRSFSFCPDCGQPLDFSSSSGSYPSPSNSGMDSDKQSTDMLRPHPANPKLRRDGSMTPSQQHFSTKLSAVVQNISESNLGIKHIVFSYWISTHNQLAQLLRQQNITYVRVDGETSYSDRSKNLKAFREEPQVTVLLMSIETGALGLNLTAASSVHIVEPQWNPSVEEQAVARALRMGQTKEVTIFRYIINGTVEQNMLSLQQRKKGLAKFVFDTSQNNEVSERLEVRTCM